MSLPRIPKLTDHGSEIALLSWMATGVLAILIVAALKGQLVGRNALDVAAFLLVLQRIIEAITARWTQRSVDRMGQQLGASAPTPDTVEKTTVEGTN